MARVYLPIAARSLVEGAEFVDVPGRTISELIEELDRQYPGVKARLCAGDRLQPGLAAVVNGSIASLGVHQGILEPAEVHFLPALGGG